MGNSEGLRYYSVLICVIRVNLWHIIRILSKQLSREKIHH